MTFLEGVMTGVVGTLLVVGITHYFFGKNSPLVGRVPRWHLGVATKLEQQTLNGIGLLCLVCQAVITLFVALLLTQEPMNQYGLMLVTGWLTSSLLFGFLFAFLGARIATVVLNYDGTERPDG